MTHKINKLIYLTLLITISLYVFYTPLLLAQNNEIRNNHLKIKVAAAQILTDYDIENNEKKISNSINLNNS